MKILPVLRHMMLHARTTPATTDGQMTVTALQSLFDHDWRDGKVPDVVG